MLGIAAASAALIAEAVVGYAEGEVIGKVKDAAMDKIGDRKLSKYILEETAKAAEKVPLTECTRMVFDPGNKKFKTIRKSFANAVLRWNSDIGEIRGFITDPPCAGYCLGNVARDLVALIRAVKDRLFGDDEFRNLMREDRFMEVLYKEFVGMKAEFEAFKEKMSEMEIALKVLADEVAELRESSGPPKPELVSKLISTSSAFIGREAEIAKIREAFGRGNTVFVTGIGGIGKTEICREYAYRCMSSEQKVAWLTFSGSTRATVSSGLEFRNLDDSSMDEDERFTAKVRWIPNDALIVVDNYVQEEDMADLLSLPCRVLVSTRMLDGADSVVIEPLPEDEAFGLLRSRVHPELRGWADGNREELMKVLSGMERLTVMIPLIAGIINERRPDPKSLASDILGQAGKVTLTKDGRTERTDIIGHLRALMGRSELSDGEKDILRVMSMAPPGGIRSDLLEDLAGIDSDNAHRLIGLGLVRNEYGGDGIFRSIHPLVAEFIRADYPPAFADGDLCRDYAENLSKRTKGISNSARISDLGLYVGAVVSAAEALKGCGDYALTSSCLNTFSTGLSKYGMHREALSLALEELRIVEAHMTEDLPSIAISYNNIGGEYSYLGDHGKALDYRLKALEIREKALPEGHPSIATSYNNIGVEYSHIGDHEKALEYYLKALEIREKALPEGHPDVATSYSNIGGEYSYLGDHGKALEYRLKALEIREKALPEGHPDIAMSYNNVGVGYNSSGTMRRPWSISSRPWRHSGRRCPRGTHLLPRRTTTSV